MHLPSLVRFTQYLTRVPPVYHSHTAGGSFDLLSRGPWFLLQLQLNFHHSMEVECNIRNALRERQSASVLNIIMCEIDLVSPLSMLAIFKSGPLEQI